MSHFTIDSDEWESVVDSRPCSACQPHPNTGIPVCTGRCNGMLSISQRRRAPEEVARIKAERRQKHEDAVLAEADAIRARRASHD